MALHFPQTSLISVVHLEFGPHKWGSSDARRDRESTSLSVSDSGLQNSLLGALCLVEESLPWEFAHDTVLDGTRESKPCLNHSGQTPSQANDSPYAMRDII